MVEERFGKFEWNNSEEWQSHLRNVFPVPTIAQIHKIKRKWFRQHIDSSLPLEPAPPSSSPPPSSSESYVPPPPPPTSRLGLMWLPGLLFLLWPAAWIYGKGIHVAIAGFAAGVIGKYGVPKLNMYYWQPVAQDDDMHSVAYCLLLLMFPDWLATQLPVLLGAVCWVVSAAARFPSTQALSRQVNLYAIGALKSDCEVALGLVVLLSIPAPGGSFVVALIFWQFLRMKYMMSNLTKASFGKLRMYGDAALGTGLLKGGWEKVKTFGGYMTTVEQGQSGSGCSVM